MHAVAGPVPSSSLMLVWPFLNLSIHLQTFHCDTALFPYCTNILPCISAAGKSSAHKKTHHHLLLFFHANETWGIHIYGTKWQKCTIKVKPAPHCYGWERYHINCVEPYQQCNLSQKLYLHNRESLTQLHTLCVTYSLPELQSMKRTLIHTELTLTVKKILVRTAINVHHIQYVALFIYLKQA